MSVTDDCPIVGRLDLIADLMTETQISMLRRCDGEKAMYALMMIGWRGNTSDSPDALWSMRAPNGTTREQQMALLKEAVRILVWQIEQWEKEGKGE